MKATATPVREFDSNTYTCRRCGIRNSFGGSVNGRPDMCRDCKWVLAYREPETPRPKPAVARLPHLTDAECLAARNAMRRGDRSPEVDAAAREYWRRKDSRKRSRAKEAS